MDALGSSLVGMWLLLGDFNATLFQEERPSRLLIDQHEIEDFVSYYDGNYLRDAQTSRDFFTWNKKQKGATRSICPKIGHVLINLAITISHLSFLVEFKEPVVSNHFVIWVQIKDQLKGIKKPFRFLNVWTQHLIFNSIVKEVW